MNAKKVLINHEKKGQVPLGSLSHNELCKGIVSLMEEVQKSHIIIESLYKKYYDQQDIEDKE